MDKFSSIVNTNHSPHFSLSPSSSSSLHISTSISGMIRNTTTSMMSYAGHKQPGLHGSKSFGVLWRDAAAGHCHPQQHMTSFRSAASEQGSHTSDGGNVEEVRQRNSGTKYSNCGGLRKMVKKSQGGVAVGLGFSSVADRRGSGRRRGKGSVDLIPVRGISRAAPFAT